MTLMEVESRVGSIVLRVTGSKERSERHTKEIGRSCNQTVNKNKEKKRRYEWRDQFRSMGDDAFWAKLSESNRTRREGNIFGDKRRENGNKN